MKKINPWWYWSGVLAGSAVGIALQNVWLWLSEPKSTFGFLQIAAYIFLPLMIPLMAGVVTGIWIGQPIGSVASLLMTAVLVAVTCHHAGWEGLPCLLALTPFAYLEIYFGVMLGAFLRFKILPTRTP